MPNEVAYVRVHGGRRGGRAPCTAKNASSLPTVAAANGHRALNRGFVLKREKSRKKRIHICYNLVVFQGGSSDGIKSDN